MKAILTTISLSKPRWLLTGPLHWHGTIALPIPDFFMKECQRVINDAQKKLSWSALSEAEKDALLNQLYNQRMERFKND